MPRRKVKRQPGRSKRWGNGKVNTGPAKMAGFMNDQKKFVDMSLGSRSRVARGGEGYSRNHDYLMQKFPGPPPLETAKPEQIVAKAMLGYPRAVVLTQLMQGKYRWQKERTVNQYKLLDGKAVKLTLFIGANVLFFVKETLVGYDWVILHSITYSSLDRAMRAWRTGNVAYVSRVVQKGNPPLQS